MEYNSFGEKSYDDPDKDTDKPDKKSTKKSTASAPSVASSELQPKTKAERDIVRSIDRLPLFEKPPEIAKESKDAKKPEADQEADAPALESIGEDEAAHIQQEVARDHLEAIEHADGELAEDLEPAAEFLQRVSEGETTDEAFAAVAAEIGLSEDEINDALTEVEPAIDQEEFDELAMGNGEYSQPTNEQNGDFDTSEDAEGEIDWRSPATPTGSAAATPPPSNPRRFVVMPAVPATPIQGVLPNSAPTTPSPLPERANDYYQDRNKAGELLLIGLVGYLIGRRRGRIRTERKLLPAQRKLEKQVKQLEQDITYKERQLVAAKAARKPEVRSAVAPIAAVERTQPGRRETRLNMQKPVRAERLGHMIVAAEAPAKTTAKPVEKTRFEKPNSIRDSFRPEAVKDMQRAELLELSEKITVEGATLRSVYESRLIGEKQLRHLVSEYLRGKDIRNDLRKEMVEHEIDFERDPILRDRARSMLNSNDGGTGFGEMLAKAGIAKQEVDPTIEHRAKAEARKATTKRKKQRVAADAGMVTAIVVLAVIVAILVVSQ